MVQPASVIVVFIQKCGDHTDSDARYSNADRHCNDV